MKQKDDTAGGVFADLPRRFPAPPELRKDFAEVVHAIYDSGLDVLAEYKAVEASLSTKDPLNPGALRVAANRSEEMARRAYRLYLVARYEYEAYLRATEPIVGAVREAARQRLEVAKKAGTRTKQVTDADVECEAAEKYADEWNDVHNRRERARGMMQSIEKLAELASKRSYTLARLIDPNTAKV